MKLFSGTSNEQLSKNVSTLLNIPLAQAEVVRFENSEVRIRIVADVKDQVCAVVQSTSNPTDENLIELLFFCDALSRSEAKKVIAIIPYFGYARQNIQHRSGEDVSAHVVVKLLESVGFDEVWTFDLHDEGMQGIFSVPLKPSSAFPLLAQKIKQSVQDDSNIGVVSPDQGGVERARNFSNSFFGSEEEIAVVEKRRDLDHIHESKAVDLYGDVSEKTVILVDDIVNSGGTLLNAAELCLQKGAKRVLAAVVHHDFGPDTSEKIQLSSIEKFFTTDTIFLKDNQKFPKLEELSIAPLIAEELKKIF